MQTSEKIGELFDLMDFDGNGYISDDEVADMDINVSAINNLKLFLISFFSLKRFELIARVFDDFYSIIYKRMNLHNEL